MDSTSGFIPRIRPAAGTAPFATAVHQAGVIQNGAVLRGRRLRDLERCSSGKGLVPESSGHSRGPDRTTAYAVSAMARFSS
jgi:hypothetical protein